MLRPPFNVGASTSFSLKIIIPGSKEELHYYPASYEYVLSVSSSNDADTKAAYASWSQHVDLLAPGLSVFSTSNGGGYGRSGGTSFASPQVAGAAALLRAHFPELTALQVMERLRVASDDVSGIAGNEAYHEKIGKGRLNMEKALGTKAFPAVRMQQFDHFNGIGPFAFPGDTLEIRMDFINHLSEVTNLKIGLSSNSPYVTILESGCSFASISTLEQVRNQHQPFRIYLHPDLPDDEIITFRIGFSGTGYNDYQHFKIPASGSYLDFKADDLSLTISANGNLGYNSDYLHQGTGFRYKNELLAHNLGLLIAHSPTAVANNMPETLSPIVRNKDFTGQSRLKLYPNSTAAHDARTAFITQLSGVMPLNLLVEQKVLAWEDQHPGAGFVLEYRIINTADQAYEQLQTGLFADFDLQDFEKNKVRWDAANLLGYAFDHEESQFAGLALLSDFSPAFHALDLASNNGNQAEVEDSISRAAKYEYLSQGISKETAGTFGPGNDVAQLLGGTIPLLEPNQGKKIAFALLRASSLAELQEAATLARTRYEEYLQKPPLHAWLLACPGNPLTIQPTGGELFRFYSDPYGEQLIAEGSSLLLENPQQDLTLYLANADKAYLGDIERIEVVVKEPLAGFIMSSDTLAVLPGETAVLELTDQSEYPASWKWDFSNGYTSIRQSPKAYFNSTGTYTIRLEMTNLAGCTASNSRQLVVVYKEEAPQLENQLLCGPGSTTLQTADGSRFTLYADAEKQEKLFEGILFETGHLKKDTTFYASRGNGAHESDLQGVRIRVFSPGISISYAIDSTAESRYGLTMEADLQEPALVSRLEWYINGKMESNETSLSWPYAATDTLIEAHLLVFYTNGCQLSTLRKIRLQQSSNPILEPVYACKGDAAVLRPKEEGLYYFYADEEKVDLLKKGREYKLEALTASQTLFVSNISQGQESTLHSAHLLLPDSLAYFDPASDTLWLTSGSGQQFQSWHPEASEWHWDFGDGFISSLPNPVHTYSSPGTYTISLTTRSEKGCSETFNRTLVVAVQPTGLPHGGHLAGLKSYPNPVGDDLFLHLPAPYAEARVQIYSLNGKIIRVVPVASGQSSLRIPLSDLTAGVYVLQLQSRTDVYTHRFIKK